MKKRKITCDKQLTTTHTNSCESDRKQMKGRCKVVVFTYHSSMVILFSNLDSNNARVKPS